MPISEMDLIDVVKALEGEVRLNDQEKTLRGNMYFQCVVNCKGKARQEIFRSFIVRMS